MRPTQSSAQGTKRVAIDLPAMPVEPLEQRRLLSGGHDNNIIVTQTNLVSDGVVATANPPDADLKNAWGISFGPGTPFWISDNGTHQTTLYDQNGVKQALKVAIPGDGGQDSAPTGQSFNPTGDFKVTGPVGTDKALFIFAGEDGGISGWSPNADPANAILEVKQANQGSIFKGMTLGVNNGQNLLYATDFHNGKVDVFDGTWQAVNIPGAFTDPRIPAGFAPFNIQNLGGKLYVTYAKQDADAEDDVAGRGNGFVDVYSTGGALLQRFKHVKALNSPWGLAVAPPSFGNLAGDTLVGQFGSGQIAAFDSRGHFDGVLRDASHHTLTIDGLWAITPGGSGKDGDPNTLYFTAGPNDEADGIFGSLTPTVVKDNGHHGDNGDNNHDGDDDGDALMQMLKH
jgi:uncharacterized protein (TIGR03118 family)